MKTELYDLLTSDVYTDAPEYAERVARIKELVAEDAQLKINARINEDGIAGNLPEDDYVLTDGAAWFTVGELSVRIRTDGDRVHVDIYPLHREAEPAMATCSVSESEDEGRWTNHYFHCGVQWDDMWSCQCDDECPVCHAEIEPYASTDNNTGDVEVHAQDVYDLAEKVAPLLLKAKNLYDVAKNFTLEAGMPWTDPRTGKTHQPKKKSKNDLEVKTRSKKCANDETICMACREINILPDGLTANMVRGRPCDDCKRTGTLMAFPEYLKLSVAETEALLKPKPKSKKLKKQL